MSDVIDRAALVKALEGHTRWPKGLFEVRGIIEAQAPCAAPSPALTRERLAAALHGIAACQHWEATVRPKGRTDPCPNTERHLYEADAILSALSKTPPPSSTREEPAP